MKITLFGCVFLPLLIVIVLWARRWLPALLIVAATLQAASVLNVDLAVWFGPDSGLGLYGITPYNATALCLGLLLPARLANLGLASSSFARVGTLLLTQLRVPIAFLAGYALVAVLGAFVLPQVFEGTRVHEMLSLYGMSKPPVPVRWTLSNAVQAANLCVHCIVLLYLVQCLQDDGFYRRLAVGTVAALLLVLGVGFYERLAWVAHWPSALGFWLNNPGYALVGGNVTAGDLMRVSSPFSEPSYASSYLATTTLGSMAVAAFSRDKNRRRFALTLGGASALGLFNTLGSTGWAAAGLSGLAMVFWMGARTSVLDEHNQIRTREALIWVVLSAVLVATLWTAQSTRYSQDIDGVLNELLLNKAQPGNREERELTNSRALDILVETYGMGVGLGSNRASSFVASLLSNSGVLGTVLFFGMIVSLLWSYFRALALSDSQLFVGMSLFTATIAVGLGIPDLNLPMYWVFVFLGFTFCPAINPQNQIIDAK